MDRVRTPSVARRRGGRPGKAARATVNLCGGARCAVAPAETVPRGLSSSATRRPRLVEMASDIGVRQKYPLFCLGSQGEIGDETPP